MIRIESAALRATVQDRGRAAHLRLGVPVSGPADPLAYRAAQALVGNEVDDAAIEIVGAGFTFVCDDARIVAVTGREASLVVRDTLPGWSSVFVRGGQRVTVRITERTRFAYVAVSGGIATPRILGSRSAYPPAGIGAPLRPDDALPLGTPRADASAAGRRVAFRYDGPLAAVPGPHLDRFDDGALAAFFGSVYRASVSSDRQGARLDGPPIPPRGGEVLACGVVAGAVQVPRDGRPIVLLADHQTTGGYPVVATIIESDLGRVAQAGPDDELRFERVDRAQALVRDAALAALLGALSA